MRSLSRLSCYCGKVGTVKETSIELLGDGWEIKHNNGKHDGGGD